jgi:DNA-binding response OmpR family regulator
MKALLIEADPKNRDIIRTGLDQFQAFQVDHAVDDWGVDMAREKQYDLILVDLELANGADGMTVIKSIREFDSKVEIILITRGRTSRLLSKEKQTSNLFGLLHLPIEEMSFFKLLARARDRMKKS